MKLYIKATTEKPTIDQVTTEWEEFEDGTGIKYTIYSGDDVIFEEIFNYADIDSDAVYDSAADLAILSLSQQYDLSDDVINTIKGE